MGYLERLLIPGESILHRARRSAFPSFAKPLLAFVAAVGAALAASLLAPGPGAFAWALPVVAAAWLGWRWVWWRDKVYLVTNHRVLKLEGVLAKSHGDASLDKINDMQRGVAAPLPLSLTPPRGEPRIPFRLPPANRTAGWRVRGSPGRRREERRGVMR